MAVILGTEGPDSIVGSADSDILAGNEGDDTLIGGAGNDRLDGGYDDDILEGGSGNDTLDGGDGSDVYRFASGFGQDTLRDDHDPEADPPPVSYDVIEFGAGILAADLIVTRDERNLYIAIRGSTDRLTLLDHFVGRFNHPIREVRFADGTVWNDPSFFVQTPSGTPGNDTLYAGGANDTIAAGSGNDSVEGANGNDVIAGDSGNDTLEGGAGDDVLDGGTGDDTLMGGTGSDTYSFGRGLGNDRIEDNSLLQPGVDVIVMGAGVRPQDVLVTNNGNDVFLTLAGTGERLTLVNHLGDIFNPDLYRIEEVRFADGTVWTDLNSRVVVTPGTDQGEKLYGTANGDLIDGLGGDDELRGFGGDDTMSGGTGNDDLFGDEGNDVFDGGTGDDVLVGNNGNDRYRFARGDGHDTIMESDGSPDSVDILEFAAGIRPEDVAVSRNDEGSLFFSLVGSSDVVEVWGYFPQFTEWTYHQIEEVHFADGTVWTDLPGLLYNEIVGTSGNNTLNGSAGADWIKGRGGDDKLNGAAGNDTLDGGSGEDTMKGGAGNDLYIVDNSGDVVTESSGQGMDTVESKYSYTLTANVENLVITGDYASTATGNALDNQIFGNERDNTLNGRAGDDTLFGDFGDDTLVGGDGGDTYLWGHFQGHDVIRENDSTPGDIDVVSFLDFASNQVWFHRNGNDLEVSLVNTDQGFTIDNWYLGSSRRIEEFHTFDDKVLLGSQVQNLVNAMAAFAPPAPGQSLPPADQAKIDQAIAANWH